MVYFIDETYLKRQTTISGNFDVVELVPFILQAQDMHIQELTGSELYNELLAAIQNSTVTSDQATLLALIRPALAYYTAVEAMPSCSLKIRPKGVVKGEGDGVTSATIEEIEYLRGNYRVTAEFHGQRVKHHLRTNVAKFPAYYRLTAQTDIAPNDTAYTMPIAFDDEGMNKNEKDFYRRWLL